MSGTDRIAGQPDCGHDAAPYVLGALEPAEARAFARHLERCAICRNEVAALAPVLDALPAPAPAHGVPRGLRRRVLRAARAEPKAPHRRVSRPRRRPYPTGSPAGWLAVGLAVIAAVLAVQLRSTPSPERTIPATVGQAQLRVAGGRGELVVAHLPALPADRTYELWLVNGNRDPVPSTLFGVTSDGTADVGVPGDMHGLRRLLVTVEPRGGSPVPTGRAIVVAPLA